MMQAFVSINTVDTNLQPGANISFIHALHFCFILKFLHHAVHQIHQGPH